MTMQLLAACVVISAINFIVIRKTHVKKMLVIKIYIKK